MSSRLQLGSAFRRWGTGLRKSEDHAKGAGGSALLPEAGELRRLLDDAILASGVPGAALSVVVDGTAVNATAGVRSVDEYFPLLESARFECLGLTRLAVAGVVHKLADAGTLGLDDPIERWLPELAGREAGEGISVAHLLSHTSGYLGENPANLDKLFHYPWDEFVAFFGSTPQAYEPGTTFGVVESEYAMIGEAVRRAAGDDALNLAGEMLLKGLSPATGDDDPGAAGGNVPGHTFMPFEGGFAVVDPAPPCGFWAPSLLAPAMTTELMARLAELLLVRPGSLGCRPALAKRLVPLPAQMRGVRCAETPGSFGLGCGEFAPGVFGLSSEGMGQCNAVRAVPDRGVSLAVALHCHAPRLRDKIAADALALVADVEPVPTADRIELDRPAEEFEGVYRAAHWQTLRVTLDGDRLHVANGYNPWLPVDQAAVGATLDILDPRTCAFAEGSEDWSLGFFSHPNTGTPCLMVGLSAFARME